MGILDGSMPLIVPVLESPKQQEMGMRYADNFLRSYENAKDRAERVRQFDLGEPLRKAQVAQANKSVAMADAQLGILRSKAEIEALGAQAEKSFEQKKLEALRFEQSIAGNYGPESRVGFLKLMEKNPDLYRSQWANKMEEMFAASDKARNEVSRLSALHGMNQRENDIRSKRDLGERFGIQIFDDAGNEIPGAYQKANEAAANASLPYRERAAESWAQNLKKSRPELTEPEIEDAKLRFMTDPRSLNPGEVDRRSLLADAEAADSLDQAVENIDRFNQKYGAGAFDKFTGPIDARIQKLKQQYKITSDDERIVRQIFTEVGRSLQGYRKANFGTALTESEIKAFRKIVDDPESATYLDSLFAFKEGLKDSVSRRIENYPYASNLPPKLTKEMLGRQRGKWMMPEAQAAESGSTNAPVKLPTGWKFAK